MEAKLGADLGATLKAGLGRALGAGLGAGLGHGLGGRRPVPVPPGARFEERRFAGPAGSLTYKVFVPSGRNGEALPVVVMLHGCTQDPDDFALGTRMNALAEEQGAIVVYPRQERAANAQKCWNWFQPGDQGRGAGEPALIAGIAREVVAEFGADPARVYVAGLSAGGAAAAILASAYPDVFAAAGIHSGLACGAARDLPSALAAMGQGGTAPKRAGGSVPTIVFHGDGDRTVHPLNGERVAAQALPGPGLTETVTRGESPGGIAWTRSVHADAEGRGSSRSGCCMGPAMPGPAAARTAPTPSAGAGCQRGDAAVLPRARPGGLSRCPFAPSSGLVRRRRGLMPRGTPSGSRPAGAAPPAGARRRR